MALASSLRRVASKVIGVFGGEVDVTLLLAKGQYDPASGGVAGKSVETIETKGVLEDVYDREVGLRLSNNRLRMDGVIQAGDRRLVIAAQDVDPDSAVRRLTAAATATIREVTYQVIGVFTIEQANQPITYELILRS